MEGKDVVETGENKVPLLTSDSSSMSLIQAHLFDTHPDDSMISYRAQRQGLDPHTYVQKRHIQPFNESLPAHDGELIYMVARGFDNTMLDSSGRQKLYVENTSIFVGVIGLSTKVPDDAVLYNTPLLIGLPKAFERVIDEETRDELMKERGGRFYLQLRDNYPLTSHFYALMEVPAVSPDIEQSLGRSSSPRLECAFGSVALMRIQAEFKAYEYYSLQKELGNKLIPESLEMKARDITEKQKYFHEVRKNMRTPNKEELQRLVKLGQGRGYHLCERKIPSAGDDVEDGFILKSFLKRLDSYA